MFLSNTSQLRGESDVYNSDSRTSNVYYADGAWFFFTKELHDFGPYKSLDEAEIALMYLRGAIEKISPMKGIPVGDPEIVE